MHPNIRQGGLELIAAVLPCIAMNLGRVFLTGQPGCGKTTVIANVIQMLSSRGIRPGGMISGEMREAGVRVGFSIEDIVTHEIGILAHTDYREGPHVGKYHVNLFDVDRIGVAAIKRALSDADLVIVDELGPMELHSLPFINAVRTALSSTKPFLGTIHKRANHPLVTSIRSNTDYRIIEVTTENRRELPGRIVEQFAG